MAGAVALMAVLSRVVETRAPHMCGQSSQLLPEWEKNRYLELIQYPLNKEVTK